MTEDVKEQEAVVPETVEAQPQGELSSKARENFSRLEAAREAERDARIRAEMQLEMQRKELEEIKQMLQPKEQDPLEGVEDYVDANRLKAKLAQESAALERKAREIAKRTYEEEKKKELDSNFMQRLKAEFHDYDEVMNEANVKRLEKNNPRFLEKALNIKDDYERRLLTYEFIRATMPKKEEVSAPSIKERVEENAKNPYFIPSSVGAPTGIDFDVKSPAARQQAYEKLKAAQRKPIGNGQAPLAR